MAKTTKLKQKLKRQQLPKLTPAQLNHALALLEQSGLDATSKAALTKAFTEMADDETGATVQYILRLPDEQRQLIHNHARQLRSLSQSAISRASSALMAMADEEWDRLVSEAEAEGTSDGAE
jgi:hypothetical protein